MVVGLQPTGLTRGDRGLLTSARIEQTLRPAGLDWITALRAPAIKQLAAERRAIAALAVHACPGEGRGPRHGGNHQPRLSGRTPGGVQEPVAGRRAGPQTRRTV